MKRVLFDENLPRKLRRELPDCFVRTVQEEGWGSFQNGELLRKAEGSFDVLVTADRRMQYQQNLTGYAIAVIVIVTPRLHLRVLLRIAAALRITVDTIQTGEIVQLHV